MKSLKGMWGKAWGWRVRVGLIMPASQIMTEPLFYSLAPKGVAFHTARLFVPQGNIQERIAATEALVPRAVDELLQSKVDCIAYLCVTGGLLRGIEGEKEFCKRVWNPLPTVY